ncbi:MAG: ATP-binding protein [Bacteroidota bacterium]
MDKRTKYPPIMIESIHRNHISHHRLKLSIGWGLPLLLWFFLGSFQPLHAQTQRLAFDYINIKEGLPANGAFDLIQDHQGYIWMCTLNGLVKYDGYQFKVFRGTPGDPTGETPVGRSFVSALLAKDNRIWVSTLNSGFSAYNPQTEEFINFPNAPDAEGNILYPRHDIVKEDSKGRIWMYAVSPATGKAKIQYFDTEKDTLIQFDQIHDLGSGVNFEGTLVEDSKGHIYIHQSDSGIYKLSDDQHTFELFLACRSVSTYPLNCEEITHLRVDTQDRLWIGTDQGIKIYHLAQGMWQPTSAVLGGNEALLSQPISYTYQDQRGNIWMFVEGQGMACLQPEGQRLKTFDLLSSPFDQLGTRAQSFVIRPVMEDMRGIWFMNDREDVQSLDRNFFFYDHALQQLVSYGDKFNFPDNQPNDYPSSFLIDQSGLMWISNIGGGVNRQDPNAQRIDQWNHTPGSDLGLATDSIEEVFEDRLGQIWITGKGKLHRFDKEKLIFETFETESKQDLRFNHIVEDEKGQFWIGSDRGLYLFDPSKGTFQQTLPYRVNGGSGVAPLFIDEQGKLWIQYTKKAFGHDYGYALGTFDPQDKKIISDYYYDPNDSTTLSRNLILDVLYDSKKRIWVSTFGGLCRYESAEDRFTRYYHDPADPASLSNDFTSILLEDKNQQIWIGTYNQGLNRYDETTDQFKSYKDNNGFLAILSGAETKDGHLWWGTYRGEGLFKMNPQTETLSFYNQSMGLASDRVLAITEDDYGYLWMPSESGLSRFDPQSESFTIFDESDGFVGYDEPSAPPFSRPFKASNGDIWLNTYTQLFRIQPRKLLQPNSVPPQVVLRSLKIGNEVYSAADGELLKDHISRTSALNLAYGQNDLTFEFVGLHYARAEENTYAFKLEGIDDDWSDPSKDRKARYAGLPPGNYTFRVKASNAEGVWSEGNTSIQISIAKAWWQTTAAFIVYFILLAIGVWFFIRWYTRKQEEKIKRQEEELELERQLTEQLRALDQLKDQFLANTSHELRTPLNGIIGLSEGVYDRTDHKTDKEDLELIISSGKRLHHLVDDLLDFSKLRSGEFELERHPVDLSSVIELIFRMSGPAANKKGLSLVNAVPFSLPAVDADPFRLQQILFNLIGNAIKFTEEGEVRVHAEAVGSQVKISISDTGIGIPQEKLNAIFDAFQQADGSTARKFGGTGLGLTITKQLVSLHGGEIGVHSEIGEGSTFWFTLGASDEEGRVVQVSDDELSVLNPSALNGTASAASTPMEVEPIEEFSDQGKLRILIVDDEQVNQRVMKSHLENDRFDLVFADDGDMALDIMRNSPKFDLVLLDVMMPNMSGYEVCKKIREEYLPSELPVIMVTAKNQVNDLVQGLTRGANDYLAKPFSKQEFLARVKTQIDLNQIFSIADRFIPNEFIRTLGHERLTEVQLGDLVEREVSVMFTDIRSYTSLSEGMTPADTFKFINGYTNRMGPIIQDNRGFVNQYLGDGIMAIFQYRPDDALDAMIGMQVKLREYNVERIAKGRPEISVGMGLHTGPLIMGIIGDSRRSDAATISDTVNTSARMEGLTKSFGVRILVSGSSYRGLEEPDQFHFRYIGKVKVKGKNESIEVFECIDGDPK